MKDFNISVRFIDVGICKVVHHYDNTYTIELCRSQMQKLKANPLSVVMHELGHVLAREFELPAHSKILNFNFVPDFLTMWVEREAWDVAEKLFNELRVMALDMYAKQFENKP